MKVAFEAATGLTGSSTPFLFRHLFQIMTPYIPWTLDHVKKYALLLLRYLLYYALTEVFLSLLYVSALGLNHEIVQKLDMWTLTGLSYSHGQLLHLKYVFFYGISIPIVMTDGIGPRNHPKCIGRIHLYSDMWRHFDEGLYKFMHK